MNKERIDDLVDILGEEYARIENTFVIRNQQQLVKYLENPTKWKSDQLKSRAMYKRELIGNAKPISNKINKLYKIYLKKYFDRQKGEEIQRLEKELKRLKGEE